MWEELAFDSTLLLLGELVAKLPGHCGCTKGIADAHNTSGVELEFGY